MLAALAVIAWGLASPAEARAARDPVVRSINHAVARGHLKPTTGSSYVRHWRVSARTANRLQRRGRTLRSAELRAARGRAIELARRGALNGDRLPAVIASVRASTYVFSSRSFPRRQERVTVPFDHVVFVYQPGSGMQFHPLHSFSRANRLYSAGDDENLVKAVDRLRQLSVWRAGFTTWEYYFPYAGGRAPWISGMAQGVALQVFARAAKRTGEDKYMKVAQSALPGFTLTPRQGGFTTYQSGGRWYLLYGFHARQRILNGHLQALIGLHDYWKESNDPVARERFDQGLAAGTGMLGRFDTGAWSNYQPGQEANLDYHDLMTHQLRKLGGYTERADLLDAATRFSTYRVTAPKVELPSEAPRVFFPHARDRWKDAARVTYRVDKRSSMSLRVVNAAGTPVRTYRATARRGLHTMSWDGRTAGGRTAPAGSYALRLVATDVAGNTKVREVPGVLEIRRDRTAPTLDSVRVRSLGRRRTAVDIVVHDTDGPSVLAHVVRGGRVIGVKRARRTMRIVVAQPRRVVLRGTLRLYDTSGNRNIIAL